jgi:hypothetical protein
MKSPASNLLHFSYDKDNKQYKYDNKNVRYGYNNIALFPAAVSF